MTDEEYQFLRGVCNRLIGRWKCSRRWSVDEFVSWGWWGWVCAKRLYNPELGEWRAFATAKIKNAVCDNLKQRKWHPQGRAKVPERIYQPTDWSNELEVWTTSLTKDEREAVVWYYRDGLTLSEIGHRQLHDQSTVSYALKRAREKIRQRLG